MVGELLEAERVYSIVGAFCAVYNYYGYGLSEAVYAGALECELVDRGHEVARELAVAVSYKGRHVAWQRLEMVVDGRVIDFPKRAFGPIRVGSSDSCSSRLGPTWGEPARTGTPRVSRGRRPS